jgi:hypothetical protein
MLQRRRSDEQIYGWILPAACIPIAFVTRQSAERQKIMQRKWINGFMLDHSGWERMASLDQRKDYPILGNCVKILRRFWE